MICGWNAEIQNKDISIQEFPDDAVPKKSARPEEPPLVRIGECPRPCRHRAGSGCTSCIPAAVREASAYRPTTRPPLALLTVYDDGRARG